MLLDRFLTDASEVDVDAVSDGKQVVIGAGGRGRLRARIQRCFQVLRHEGELALRQQWLAYSVILVARPTFGWTCEGDHDPIRFFT